MVPLGQDEEGPGFRSEGGDDGAALGAAVCRSG